MYRRLAHGVGAALISGALMVGIASPVSAQLVVYDAATTARNTITAAVKQYSLRDGAPAAHEAPRDGADD